MKNIYSIVFYNEEWQYAGNINAYHIDITEKQVCIYTSASDKPTLYEGCRHLTSTKIIDHIIECHFSDNSYLTISKIKNA
jgi:hypothetical protein